MSPLACPVYNTATLDTVKDLVSQQQVTIQDLLLL